MVKITGEYQGELHCVAVHGPSGCELNTDAPKDNMGRGEAFSPTDLLATSYATCVVTTMGIAAKKKGVELGRIRFEVTKEMSAEAPRRVVRLAAQFWMPIKKADPLAEWLETIAHNCPVHHSLNPAVETPVVFHWAE